MAKEKGKASFILYFEYKDYFEQLSVEERGELITAIFDYVVTGETKKLKGASEMAFAFIRAQIQRDLDKYEERCRVNKENGALSHKGKKESLSKPSKKDQTVANGTLNDNVPETVPEDESVPETVPETESVPESVPESVSESVAVAETESAHPNVGEDLRQNSTIRQEKQKATENDGIRQFDKNGGIRQSTAKGQEREPEKEREKERGKEREKESGSERESEKEMKKEAERERESNLRILGCLERMRRKADRISYLTEKIQGVENPVYNCFGLEQST